MSELVRTALVTGGSRGIGRAVALTLARNGLQVYLTYLSKASEAEIVVEDIRAGGGKAKAFCLDVSDAQGVEDFFHNEIKEKIFLSALVNNAGITRDGLLLRMKNDDWDSVLNADLRGPFVCSREAAKIMVKQRQGRIVNIVSVVGQTGNAGQSNYSAAKAGLIGFTKTCAKELAGRGITVNAVAPGFIETDMTAALNEETRGLYMEQIPLKRFGSAQDVAEAVAFLVSERSGYITGQVLAVNGGLYC
ncbi:MAG: 3-oxoacyl-[acyl-carrier-protein] reductase [Deltaproteobacteria bacterium]|jgi:3-oxoacyl-[acyl-carrier protein] reductase|nr:3-oxoacyl-[acyl-carrier-protein] reductase [Deltaproteobacteria bacterium]